MEQRLILRGLLAGAVGGLLAFLFARIFAEPLIQQAIEYEDGRHSAREALDKAAGLATDHDHGEVFTRAVQANVGIGVAVVVLGMAMGALYAVVFRVALGRVGKLRIRTLAMLVAAGGFLGFHLVPFLKYPANPPAIGNDDTIGPRSWLYLTMVACSIAFLVGAVVLGQRLRPRFGTWNASLLAGGAFVVAIGIVMAVLPPFGHLAANQAYGNHATETPLPLTDANGGIVFPGFPADLLYSFRLYSIGAQLLMWAAIGLVFAPLAERVLDPAPAERPAVAAAV